MKDFCDLASPLTDLTRKNVKFVWEEKQQIAFDALKTALCSAPILAYPDFSQSFILDCDVSDVGCGGILSQKINDQERVIAYFSTTHSYTERKYSTTRKELLALVKSVKYFKHYLLGKPFLVRTDNSSLKWLYNFKCPEGQVARWIEFLSSFDMQIEHRPGIQHRNVDSLSRYPATVNAIHFEGWGKGEIKAAIDLDPIISEIVKLKGSCTEKPEITLVECKSKEMKLWLNQWEQLIVEDSILYRKWTNEVTNEVKLLLVVPQPLRETVLQYAHGAPTSGHLGLKKTVSKIRQSYYWIGLRGDVSKWLKSCGPCQKRKRPTRTPRAPLVLFPVSEPLERIALDILGPLPETERGNKFVLVLSDYFTKWTEAYAIKNQEAVTIARVLIDNFVVRFGVPKCILTDQGKNFESTLFKEVCRILGIHKTRTTAYHPQTDGQVEKFNNTVACMLSAYVNKRQTDRDIHLPIVLMAYRSCVQETTKFTPNMMMLGHEINIPLSILAGPTPDHQYCPIEYVEDLHKNMSEIFSQAYQNTQKEQGRMKLNYDIKQYGKPFEKGQKVYLLTPFKKPGLASKLVYSWEGPYEIVERLSHANYIIAKPHARVKKQVVHYNRLKLCVLEPHEPFSQFEHDLQNSIIDPDVEFLDANNTDYELDLDQDIDMGNDISDISDTALTEPFAPTTRRGRQIKRPAWMASDQYEMY